MTGVARTPAGRAGPQRRRGRPRALALVLSLAAALAAMLATAPTPGAPARAAPSGGDLSAHAWLRVLAPEAQHWQRAEPEAADTATLRPAAPGPVDRRLLVLYSKRSSAYDIALTEILRALRLDGLRPELRVINVAGRPARAQAALAAAEREAAGPRDLVIAMGSGVTAMLHDSYRGGALPVVTACAKDPVLLGQVPDYEAGGDANIAYTSLNLPVEVLLAELRSLAPALSHLAILVNRANASAMRTQAEPLQALARTAGVRTRLVTIDGRGDAAAQLATGMDAARTWMGPAAAPRPDGAPAGLFLITGSTAVFRELATIDAHAGRVPVVSMIPDLVRPGADSATLSIGVAFTSNARLAAQTALEILHGRRRPADFGVGVVSPPDIALNLGKTREIGISMPFEFVERATAIFTPAPGS
jgi:putative ABC transport system substrate-binding protein